MGPKGGGAGGRRAAGGQVLRVPDGRGEGGVRRGLRAGLLWGGGDHNRGGGGAGEPVRAHLGEGPGQEASRRGAGPAARRDRGLGRADRGGGEGPARGEGGAGRARARW